jgi:hypothetical protein
LISVREDTATWELESAGGQAAHVEHGCETREIRERSCEAQIRARQAERSVPSTRRDVADLAARSIWSPRRRR